MHRYILSTKILRLAKARLLHAFHDGRMRTGAAFLMCLLCTGSGSRLVAQSPTTTQLTITANGIPLTAVPTGTVVTLTATVQGRDGAVSPGLVKFCDASAPFCTDFHIVGSVQLVAAGTAQMKFRPGPGSHRYKAVFVGTKVVGGSASEAVDVTVSEPLIYPSDTAVGVGGNPGNYYLLATVSGTADVAPTGAASFLDTTNDNYVLGTGALAGQSHGLDFREIDTAPTNLGILAFTVADFNNDGILDVAYNVDAADVSGEAAPGFGQVLLGNGDGSFHVASGYSTGICPRELKTADFNSDGIPDLVYTDAEYCSFQQQSQTSDLTVLLGNGDGTFGMSYQTLLGISAQSVAVGDFNGDGIADIAVLIENDFAFAGSLQSLVILLGKGDGTFQAGSPHPIGSVDGAMVTGDFNGDGIADLAINTGGDYLFPQFTGVFVLLGKGDGTFSDAAPVVLPVAQFADSGLNVVDVNNDGRADLVTDNANGSNEIQVLLGNGDGTFQITGSAAAPIVGVGLIQTNAFDLNGDGNADLLGFTADAAFSTVVLFGDGKGGFPPPQMPVTDETHSFSETLVYDLDGDGIPDILYVNYLNDSLSTFLTRFYHEGTASVDGISPVGTGTHYIEATYPGDTVYAPSVSVLYPLTAEPATTQLTLTANPSSSAAGQPVLLTATVSPSVAQNHVATGTVTFSCNGEPIGTGSLANGVATFSTTALAAGTDHLLAQYGGNTNFAPSSGTAVENVTGTGGCAAFTIALAPSTLRLRVALSGSVTVLLKSIDTFSGPLTLTYGTIPMYGSATLTPDTVTLTAGGSSSATLSIKTAAVAANDAPGLPGSSRVLLAIGTIFLISMPLRSRRFFKILSVCAALLLLPSMGGCGGDVTSNQFIPPGTYPIPVTATDVNGNSQTAILSLVIAQ
jgi:hypothetical protein